MDEVADSSQPTLEAIDEPHATQKEEMLRGSRSNHGPSFVRNELTQLKLLISSVDQVTG